MRLPEPFRYFQLAFGRRAQRRARTGVSNNRPYESRHGSCVRAPALIWEQAFTSGSSAVERAFRAQRRGFVHSHTLAGFPCCQAPCSRAAFSSHQVHVRKSSLSALADSLRLCGRRWMRLMRQRHCWHSVRSGGHGTDAAAAVSLTAHLASSQIPQPQLHSTPELWIFSL